MTAGLRTSRPHRGWRRGPVAIAGLVALCLAVYLPGLGTLPVIDRDEARFAQASRQMFEAATLTEAQRDPRWHSGGWIIPRVAGSDRLNKPPLIYWGQAASAWILARGDPRHDAIWMYRVPSLLAAIGTVLVVFRVGSAMFTPRVGLLAGAMLAVCPLFAWEARQARADHVLTLATTLAMWGLWRVWRAATRGQRVAFRDLALLWGATAAGVYTKGPIALVLVLLAAATLALLGRGEHRFHFRHARPALGLGAVALAFLPWVIAVAQRTGWSAYLGLVADEVLGRGAVAREGHWGPPGYHVLALVILFWPGVLCTGAALARAWRAAGRSVAPDGPGLEPTPRWRVPRWNARPEAFLLAWAAPTWLVFEIYMTKLPHYTMPLYPGIAVLSARFVAVASRSAWRGSRSGAGLWSAQSIIVAGLALAAAPWAAHADQPLSAWGLAAFALAAFGAVVLLVRTLAALRRGAWLHAQVLSIGLAAVCWIPLMQAALPRMAGLSTRAVEAARTADPTAPLAAIGFHEDSLVFLTRGEIQLLDEAGQGLFWAEHPNGLLIVPADRLSRSHVVVARVRGSWYSKGRRTELAIVRPFRPEANP